MATTARHRAQLETPRPDIALAQSLFESLHEATADDEGVTRESYGPGENAAHGMVRDAARSAGLETDVDAAGNLYMTLPGRDRTAPRVLIGSHLDSVRRGGNYDGAAGVLAGLSAVVGLEQAGITPAQDVTVMAIRAEESMWFSASYIGSRAALGLLSPGEITRIRRTDSGRTIAEHMVDCGLDPHAVTTEPPRLHPESLAAYYEVHIEQGPVLEERGNSGRHRHRNPGQLPLPGGAVHRRVRSLRHGAAVTASGHGRGGLRTDLPDRRFMGRAGGRGP